MGAVKLMKQIKKSAIFTYNAVTKKVIPQIEFLAKMMHVNVKDLPERFENAFVYFRQYPEDAFWTSISTTKNLAIDAYKMAKNFNMKDLKSKYDFYITMGENLGKEMLDESFDGWTKTTAKQVYNDALDIVKNAEETIKKLPKKLRKMVMKAYNENMEKLNKWTKGQYSYLITQWNKCPYKAVFTNKIWMELADEFMAHELVDLTKTIGKKTYIMTKEK